METSRTEIPRGLKFIETVGSVEQHCIEETMRDIPELGKSVSACAEILGDLLSRLYEEAACVHGCSGDDHFYQRIIARVVSHAMSSFRLASMGYYDESLALTRSIAEVANLLFLFAAEPNQLTQWRCFTDKQRMKDFSPFQVRMKIEGLGYQAPVDQSRYGLLCEIGVHLTPTVSPQAFNEHGRSSLGGKHQFQGFMCTLNELSIATSEAGACISRFPIVSARQEELLASAVLLRGVVGNLDLQTFINEQGPIL